MTIRNKIINTTVGPTAQVPTQDGPRVTLLVFLESAGG